MPLATEADAMREFAENVGDSEHWKCRQWILTDYDVWVRNPHYSGPPQRHPEVDDYPEDDDGGEACPPVNKFECPF
jgi:hypothetical protein